MAYLGVGLNVRYNFQFKSSPDLKMAAILKISKYLRWVHFDIRYNKAVQN